MAVTMLAVALRAQGVVVVIVNLSVKSKYTKQQAKMVVESHVGRGSGGAANGSAQVPSIFSPALRL
jgi:hypothetical protein